VAPAGIIEGQQCDVQLARQVLQAHRIPREQLAEGPVIQGCRQLGGRLRQGDMGVEAIPVALTFHQRHAALPLFGHQEALFHQHRQIHRQAVADLLDQVLDLLADLEIAEHLCIAPPRRHQP